MKLLVSFTKLGAVLAVAFAMATEAAVTSDYNSIAGRNFDYVIVGGGLTGLTVANRLTEDNNVNVLVIEAGNDDRNDPRVYDVGTYGQAFGTNLVWSFPTTYQSLSGNTKELKGGKTLGGSTSINGAAWNRGHAVQYDSIGSLGNDGWSWNDLQNYMNKAEKFTPPNNAQRALGADYSAANHGFNGPLPIGFTAVQGSGSRKRSSALSRRMYSGPQQKAFVDAIKASLGVDKIADQCSGNANGAAYTPNSIDPNNRRSSAATAYLSPVQNRANLVVLTGWRGSEIAWSGTSTKASGLTIQQTRGGAKKTINANREVILAAGAINTPALLERSGVGSSDVLSRIGVSKKIDLPGVGRNLQEQTMNTLGARTNINFGGQGPSNMIAMPNIYQLMPNATDVRNYINSNLNGWANSLVQQGHAVNAAGLLAQWRLGVSNIFDHNAPVAELFFDSGYPANSLGIDTWSLLPFSRGSTHAVSKDVFDLPSVNPNYFALPIDMDMQVAALRGGRRILQTQPLASLTVQGETQPGFSRIPDGTNHGLYRRWRDWILGTDGTGGFSTVSHQIATCSMMPRENGGVVDTHFRVYGAQNVRVIDASVLPFQVSAHLSATLYGVAEKAADTIKSGL